MFWHLKASFDLLPFETGAYHQLLSIGAGQVHGMSTLLPEYLALAQCDSHCVNLAGLAPGHQ